MSETWRGIPQITQIAEGADHVDTKTFRSRVSLRGFIAGFMAYQPAWVTFLYRVRRVLVRLIGLRQEGLPRPPRYRPDTLPMKAGEKAAFFTVKAAEEDRFWAVVAAEAHLTAHLIIVRAGETFEVVTVVHYRRWTGRLYFNLIRPFHHLVVTAMGRSAVTGRSA